MTHEEKVNQAQKYLQEKNIDGWLLYDFHRNNELALRFLEIPENILLSRRFFYWIPKKGKPIKILHVIEPYVLEEWPGETRFYHSWKTLEDQLKNLVKDVKTCAMEYSFKNAIPYVSKIDAGTFELVESFGPKVVSSGGFLPNFTAVLSKSAIQSHFSAAKVVDSAVNDAYTWIKKQLEKDQTISEYDVQQKIVEFFEKRGFDPHSPPICAVNEHSADPHYEPKKIGSSLIHKGDFILIDLWCKKKEPHSVFADITRVAIASDKPSKEQKNVFSIVRKAQKQATDLIVKRVVQKKPVYGFEVDDAARKVIRGANMEQYFVHRTGHSIEYELHGSGVHMDNLEMHDEREIIPGTCFSIEPGVYLPGKFGVRLEYDILIDHDRKVYVTGGIQDEIRCLF